jgi:hypothetical protein
MYLMKKAMPAPLLRVARSLKGWMWRLTHAELVSPEPLEDQFPWISPDVWKRIADFYMPRPAPVVFEYGTGASTLHHIRNLLNKGGTYIGVEHKPDWYFYVLHAVIRYGVRNGLTIKASGQITPMPVDFPANAYDVIFHLSGSDIAGCTVKLKLRPPYKRTQDTDGTLLEFREYVWALTESADVIIVDGRARKACINYVLDNALLRPGGLLVLFEAGRGVEGWLNSPALTGTSNYQPEVQLMLTLGGELVDGCGLDRWPGLTKRRTPGSNAYLYPLEACFLQLQI